jgi:hypothetical protein
MKISKFNPGQLCAFKRGFRLNAQPALFTNERMNYVSFEAWVNSFIYDDEIVLIVASLGHHHFVCSQNLTLGWAWEDWLIST